MAENPVVHFEIPTDDMNRAREFYGRVFDWEIERDAATNYIVIDTSEDGDGGINGGLVPRGQPWQVPGFSVRVDDIDDTLIKIEDHHGKVLGPKQDIGIGFVAYFVDTEGNTGAVLQLNSPG
jgi:predicted enzyme related to lactoylglutathione lyase